MALAVASTATTAASSTSTNSVTKPTGVAVGDLLVIVASGNQSNTPPGLYAGCTGFTAAIQAYGGVGNGFINPDTNLTYLYRIADASDVSASTYSVTNSQGGIAMFRITGWTTGNPFSHTSTVRYTGTTASIGLTATIPRIRPQILIMAGSNETASARTGSVYQITSADSNPTWTELLDTHNASSEYGSQVAYATSSDLSSITAWEYTLSSTVSGAAGALGIISEPQDVTGSASHLDVEATPHGVTPLVNVVADLDYFPITPTIESVFGKASSDTTRWTEPTKESTTWTNKEI